EVLFSFIILFVENPTERCINQSTDGARSVLGNKLLQSVQRFRRSVKCGFIGHDIPGATSGLLQCCPKLWTTPKRAIKLLSSTTVPSPSFQRALICYTDRPAVLFPPGSTVFSSLTLHPPSLRRQSLARGAFDDRGTLFGDHDRRRV